jgi:predicted RNA binding protein YcfA (HicA-like mRNA interferase family)
MYIRRERMRSYSSREAIEILRKDGWFEIGCDGDHHQFKHRTKQGKVTVTHPIKDIPKGTLKSIEKQAGVRFT